MVPTKKPKSKKNWATEGIRPEWPVWYLPDSPLGSAVKYIASFSPQLSWVGISVLKGNSLKLGPFLGESKKLGQGLHTRSELVILIYDKTGKTLGQIGMKSPIENAFGPDEERMVHQVAKELGELWPD